MSGAPHAASITVRETLELLDGAFAEVASGVAEDRYALWLGSGISLGRIPGLKLLIRNALEHLQGQVTVADANCRFRAAIIEILSTAAGLTAAECGTIDVHQPVTNWPNIDAIVQRLASNYARFLEIGVAGEPDDYILWTGADLPNAFANPASEPDTEHLCIGLLVLRESPQGSPAQTGMALSRKPSANYLPDRMRSWCVSPVRTFVSRSGKPSCISFTAVPSVPATTKQTSAIASSRDCLRSMPGATIKRTHQWWHVLWILR